MPSLDYGSVGALRGARGGHEFFRRSVMFKAATALSQGGLEEKLLATQHWQWAALAERHICVREPRRAKLIVSEVGSVAESCLLCLEAGSAAQFLGSRGTEPAPFKGWSGLALFGWPALLANAWANGRAMVWVGLLLSYTARAQRAALRSPWLPA